MAKSMTKSHIPVHEAEAQLSSCLERVERGETLVICRSDVPVAELRPITRARTQPRPLGLAAGSARMSEDFDVLPPELVAAFEGDRS